MISIIDFFGENYMNFKLEDDKSDTGGISHSEETLGEFMQDCGIEPEDDIVELSRALTECGVSILI